MKKKKIKKEKKRLLLHGIFCFLILRCFVFIIFTRTHRYTKTQHMHARIEAYLNSLNLLINVLF